MDLIVELRAFSLVVSKLGKGANWRGRIFARSSWEILVPLAPRGRRSSNMIAPSTPGIPV